jgi:hypothetical protein
MNSFWQYYLSLEEDLIRLSKYVEINEDNFKTYSIELVKIYLSTCSEVDVLAKLLSKILGNKKADSISNYSKTILQYYPNLTKYSIQIPRYSLNLFPWQDWTEKTSPKWWSSYNRVKHQRDEFYKDASLGNVLNSIAGLLVLNLYYLKQEKTSKRIDSDVFMDYELSTKLFVPFGFHRQVLVSGFIGWGGNIP